MNWEKQSQWLKDKEKKQAQLKWELGALFCIGLSIMILYIVIQTHLQAPQEHLIDGKVLPRNDAQMLNGY